MKVRKRWIWGAVIVAVWLTLHFMSSTSVLAVTTLAIWTAAYFAPSIVAAARKHPDTASIVVVNFLLGWTFIGWVVALAMAVSGHRHT